MKQCYKTKKSSQKELILALDDTKWGIPENVLQGTLFITQGWAQHWNVLCTTWYLFVDSNCI